VSSTSALNIGASIGAGLWFQNHTGDYILNNGMIRVGFSGLPGNISCWMDTVTIQGSGALSLGGLPDDSLNNAGWGGSFINTASHTIRGGGSISALSANQGQVIADNDTLSINCAVDNTGGTMSASGSGNVLSFSSYSDVNGGAINPQDGKVALTYGVLGNVTFGPGAVEIGAESNPGIGGSFQNTVNLSPGTTVTVREDSWLGGGPSPAVVNNNGAIHMVSTNPDYPTYINGPITLQGPGILTMGGPGNIVDGDTFINSAPHTIQGGGSMWSIVNNGPIIANNGTLEMDGVTGTGTVAVANGATLSIATNNLQTGDLTFSTQSNLSFTTGQLIDLKRNLSFAQTDTGKWSGNFWLYMTGQGPWQTLEVGGRDYGAVASGLTNNFSLYLLRLDGAGTQVKLVDNVDNGHRAGGRESLYVNYLQVRPNTTLNLNGIKLYALRSGTMYQVKAGQGSLYGGGKIVDNFAVPSLQLLLLN
jgi:hypothetical protein